MRFRSLTLTIEFLDGTTEQHSVTQVGYQNLSVVDEGVLHVHSQSGEYAPRVHVGSWPICNIKKYRFTER